MMMNDDNVGRCCQKLIVCCVPVVVSCVLSSVKLLILLYEGKVHNMTFVPFFSIRLLKCSKSDTVISYCCYTSSNKAAQ